MRLSNGQLINLSSPRAEITLSLNFFHLTARATVQCRLIAARPQPQGQMDARSVGEVRACDLRGASIT